MTHVEGDRAAAARVHGSIAAPRPRRGGRARARHPTTPRASAGTPSHRWVEPVHRHRRTRPHLPRRHGALRHGPGEPGQRPLGVGLVLGLPLVRLGAHGLQPHAPERHGHRRPPGRPGHAGGGPRGSVRGHPRRRHAALRRPADHDEERAEPGYYAVTLQRSRIRGGAHRHAPGRAPPHHLPGGRRSGSGRRPGLLRELGRAHPTELVQVSDTLFLGRRYSTGWAKDERVHFALVTSRPVTRGGAGRRLAAHARRSSHFARDETRRCS